MSSKPHLHGYSVGKLLGRGSYASVYLVVNQKNGAQLACKCIRKSSIPAASGNKLLKQEISALQKLQHKNIVALHSVHESEKSIYVLTELCEGGSLEEKIVASKNLDEDTSRIIFIQIMNALAYCHESGFAHRDLKPSNILITNFPEIKISDFGLSGMMGTSNMMSTACGTILFTAPECFSGHYDAVASDIWSSGVVLYTLLTGRVPWKSTNQAQMLQEMMQGPENISNVSPECNEVIRAMLNPDPTQRPKSKDVLNSPWMKKKASVPKQILLNQTHKTVSHDVFTVVHNKEVIKPVKKSNGHKLNLSFETTPI